MHHNKLENLDQIMDAAAKGRGLWVGAFVEGAAEPSTLHLTLAHLGKRKDRARAASAADACWHLAAGWPSGPVEAATWGQARLDQYAGCVTALLISSNVLHVLHDVLISALVDRDLIPDNSFDFHPHLTVSRHDADAVIELRRHARQKFTFPTISLVCGDGRADYTLGAF